MYHGGDDNEELICYPPTVTCEGTVVAEGPAPSNIRSHKNG